MTRTARERAILALAVLFAAAPFAVSLVAVLGRRHDVRWLAMALVGFAAAAVVAAIGKARGAKPGMGLMFAVVMLVVVTVLAACTAYLLGARAMPGVMGVAVVFALCFTASGIATASVA